MDYKKGMIVYVADNDGKIVEGSIVEPLNFADEELFWVEFWNKGYREVTVFTTAQLDQWNFNYIDVICVCGSWSVGHPGHSIWCLAKWRTA
jgi:hypothetical protein